MPKLLVVLIVFILVITPQLFACAGPTVTGFWGGTAFPWVTPGVPNIVGWEFEAWAPTLITRLGFYDVGGDGLAADHGVAIWFPFGGPAFVSTVVSSSDPLAYGFRWHDIAPIWLPTGIYIVGAEVYGDDLFYSQVQDVSWNGPLLYKGGAYWAGGPDPTFTVDYELGRFGPDIWVVPEPGTLLMFGTGIAGLAAALRRKLAV